MLDVNVQLKLCYQGSQDGFRSEKFKEKCYDNGEILMIIKSGNNKIFGGFTDIEWGGNEQDNGQNVRSFLFSLRDDQSILKIAHINKDQDVCHDWQNLVSLGGLDIEINLNSNSKLVYCKQSSN